MGYYLATISNSRTCSVHAVSSINALHAIASDLRKLFANDFGLKMSTFQHHCRHWNFC